MNAAATSVMTVDHRAGLTLIVLFGLGCTSKPARVVFADDVTRSDCWSGLR